jgi:hypothetical protein
VMGRYRNRLPMVVAASASGIAVLVLNVVLLLQT